MNPSPDMHPDALLGAAEPTVKRIEVEGAQIHTEVRGSGDPVLLIGAADKDAEAVDAEGLRPRVGEAFEIEHLLLLSPIEDARLGSDLNALGTVTVQPVASA